VADSDIQSARSVIKCNRSGTDNDLTYIKVTLQDNYVMFRVGYQDIR